MQHLREVQEVIAEGDFRVAYYYYVKGDRRAAAARLIGVTKRYPLYSRSDRALWMLGDIFEKSEKKEIAAMYY
jgi:outer membrane protein assembly factor BamD